MVYAIVTFPVDVCSCDNNHDQATWGREGFISLTDYNPLSREAKAGTQAGF